MSGTLTQAPTGSTSHRAASVKTTSSDHLIHIPRAVRRTTPNILRAAVAAIGVLCLLTAVTVAGTASDARSRISGVETTDAPSVEATEDFVFQVQDMDAQLLNGLLANGDTQVRVPRAKSQQFYDRDRSAADGDLEAATAALAGDQNALKQLHTLSDLFGQYQAQAVRTLTDDARDGGAVAGRTPASVRADYLVAHDILFGADDQGGLVKAANDLAATSAAAIGGTSADAAETLSAVTTALVLSGLVLLGALAALQLFVFRRFHRLVNPALVAASLAALTLMIYGTASTEAAGRDFHRAKSDAFDSVIALSQAKALGSGANADESRWLLVHGQEELAARFEGSYVRASQQLASGTATVGSDSSDSALVYDAAIASLDQDMHSTRLIAESRADRPQGQDLTASDLATTNLSPTSDLGQEFRNITFDGEADRAFEAFDSYAGYIGRDAQLRRMPLNTDADLRAAVDFDTDLGTPNTSDAAFAAYNDALDKLIQLNQDQFAGAMPAARDGIAVWTWLPYPLALLIIGLTVLGVRSRINEYR